MANAAYGFGDAAARLFLGASAALPLGAPAGAPTPADYAARLDANLRNGARPSLAYSYVVYADETHSSLPPVGFMAGLRAVFDRTLPAGR